MFELWAGGVTDLQMVLICISFFFCGLSIGYTANDEMRTGCWLGITALCFGIVHLLLGLT